VKKIFIIIVMLICLSIFFIGNANENSIYESSNYTFSAYSKVLEEGLFPIIQKHIDKRKFDKLTTKKEINTLPDEIAGVIKEFNQSKKILNTINPMILILRLENGSNIVYMLEIKMELFDSESSIKNVLNSSVLFVKRFVLIYIQKEKSGSINKNDYNKVRV